MLHNLHKFYFHSIHLTSSLTATTSAMAPTQEHIQKEAQFFAETTKITWAKDRRCTAEEERQVMLDNLRQFSKDFKLKSKSPGTEAEGQTESLKKASSFESK